MELINPLVEKYAGTLTTPEDALLKKINEETYASHADPQMLSGHVQGKFLEFISRFYSATRIYDGMVCRYPKLSTAFHFERQDVLPVWANLFGVTFNRHRNKAQISKC